MSDLTADHNEILANALIDLAERYAETRSRLVRAELEAMRLDQTAKQELIERISVELEEVRADQRAKEQVIRDLDSRLQAAQSRRAWWRAG